MGVSLCRTTRQIRLLRTRRRPYITAVTPGSDRARRAFVSDHSHSIRLQCVTTAAFDTSPQTKPSLLSECSFAVVFGAKRGRNSLILVQKGSNLPVAMSRVCVGIKLAGVLIKWNVRSIQLSPLLLSEWSQQVLPTRLL